MVNRVIIVISLVKKERKKERRKEGGREGGREGEGERERGREGEGHSSLFFEHELLYLIEDVFIHPNLLY